VICITAGSRSSSAQAVGSQENNWNLAAPNSNITCFAASIEKFKANDNMFYFPSPSPTEWQQLTAKLDTAYF